VSRGCCALAAGSSPASKGPGRRPAGKGRSARRPAQQAASRRGQPSAHLQLDLQADGAPGCGRPGRQEQAALGLRLVQAPPRGRVGRAVLRHAQAVRHLQQPREGAQAGQHVAQERVRQVLQPQLLVHRARVRLAAALVAQPRRRRHQHRVLADHVQLVRRQQQVQRAGRQPQEGGAQLGAVEGGVQVREGGEEPGARLGQHVLERRAGLQRARQLEQPLHRLPAQLLRRHAGEALCARCGGPGDLVLLGQLHDRDQRGLVQLRVQRPHIAKLDQLPHGAVGGQRLNDLQRARLRVLHDRLEVLGRGRQHGAVHVQHAVALIAGLVVLGGAREEPKEAPALGGTHLGRAATILLLLRRADEELVIAQHLVLP
jgi:hypothetical protein